ncbi:DUF3224 domain-containing protein [soil metagenome]
MSESATSKFEIESWDESPYDEREGTKLTRTRVTKTFHGDIEGESTTELLMAYGSTEGSAAYVGFERIVGSVYERSGSFVLHHTASMSRNGQTASWSVVPDSATGDLLGLHGEAQISVEPDGGHVFTLNYDFK